MKKSFLIAGALLLAAAGPAAQASDSPQWIWRVGLHSVQPKSNNSDIVNVDPAATLTFNGTYLFADHWGVELLAALPFKHDINLNGAGKVAETKHLPPTLSLQYHFNPSGTLRPYVGAGLNYTLFFSEKTTGALAGTDLSLDSSFGPALQAGFDVGLQNGWFVNADIRWFDIDTKAKLDGASIGTVHIDPYAIGLSVGKNF